MSQPPEQSTRQRTGRTWALWLGTPILVLVVVAVVLGITGGDEAVAGLEAFVTGVVYLALGVALYFLPTYIATKRKVRQQSAVVVINLLLGWTLIGWVVALAMAFAATDQPGPPAS